MFPFENMLKIDYKEDLPYLKICPMRNESVNNFLPKARERIFPRSEGRHEDQGKNCSKTGFHLYKSKKYQISLLMKCDQNDQKSKEHGSPFNAVCTMGEAKKKRKMLMSLSAFLSSFFLSCSCSFLFPEKGRLFCECSKNPFLCF